MREVEEVLAITVLKKLIERRHLVKEEIFLGKSLGRQGLVFLSFVLSGDYYTLYLTQNGLIKKKGDDKESVLDKIDYLDVVIVYHLTHKELEKVLGRLEGNERS